MLFYIILLLIISEGVLSFEKSCNYCKFFISSPDNNADLGQCKIFRDALYFDDTIKINNFAVHCRKDEKLCGKEGLFYSEIDDIDDLIDDKYIIEQLEIEVASALQKIRNIIKKEKELNRTD